MIPIPYSILNAMLNTAISQFWQYKLNQTNKSKINIEWIIPDDGFIIQLKLSSIQ